MVDERDSTADARRFRARKPRPEEWEETSQLTMPSLRDVPRWAYAILVLAAFVGIASLVFGTRGIRAAVQGVVLGSVYVLGASGLSLTYAIKKFANFAHGDLMTAGAYVAFTVNVVAGGHILLAGLSALLAIGLVGVLLEIAVFRRLENRAAVAPLIASVGVALVIQNVISAIFTPDVQYLNVTVPPDIGWLSINPVELLTLVVAVVLIAFLHVLLRYTTLGKAMRACADDLELARTSGIDTRRVTMWTWMISGSFAGIAGVLLATIVNVTPYLGFFVLLFIFAAVIIGGIGSPYGAMLGGLIVGIVQKVSNVGFDALRQAGVIEGGAEYEPAGAFLVMILVLLFMPQGIMGSARGLGFAGLARWLARRGVSGPGP